MFGAKTVRGAYLVFERVRATALGRASPVQDTLADTHANYDRRAPVSDNPCLVRQNTQLGYRDDTGIATLIKKCGIAHLACTASL